MFTTDRDLLQLEPTLFRDVGWLSQRLIRTTGTLTSGVVTIDAGDLELSGVAPGQVALVNGVPLEVLAVSPQEATLSLIRAGPGESALVPLDSGEGAVLDVYTFEPQRAIVHGQLLRMLGIDPDVPAGALGPGSTVLTEAAVLNPRSLWLVEALGTLHLIFAAAAAPIGPGGIGAPESGTGGGGAGSSLGAGTLWARAEMYRRRFVAERARAGALIDLDGDGIADAMRTLNVAMLVRV
jgi:hypothetical protein